MSDLGNSRHRIDQVDKQIVQLLAQRFSLVKEVKSIKQATNYPFKDEDRWQQIKNQLDLLAQQNDLDSDGIRAIFDQIHKYALRYIYEV